jgi:DNA polymerase II small subunit
VNIHANRDFEGFNVLMYHGMSFNYYAENVDEIRLNGGVHNPENIMKFLMQKRHLAPTHSSTLYIPDIKRDPLIIEKVPDFFVTGHLHRMAATSYKNITLLAAGCWQAQTPFMTKVGVEADPCKAVLVNLQTRDFKILNFGD